MDILNNYIGNNNYFQLNPDCYLIKGAKRGIILRLSELRFLWINNYLTNLISNCENGKVVPHNIPNKYYDYLCYLKRNNYGDFYKNNYLYEKIRPAFTKKQAKNLEILPIIRHLTIEITGECNLDCNFCYKLTYNVNRNKGCKRFPDSIKKGVGINKWKEALLDARKLYCESVSFIGGEPFLKKSIIFELIKYSYLIGYRDFNVYTNGLLLNRDDIIKLKYYNVRLSLQAYSNKENITDMITRRKNIQKKLSTVMNLLNELKIDYNVYIVQHNNIDNANDECIEYFQNITNGKNVNIIRLYPNRNCIIGDIKKHREYRKTGINDILPKYYSKDSFYFNCQGHKCWDKNIFISFNGNVMPCHFSRKAIINNINNKSIREMLRDEEFNRYWDFNKNNVNICKDCEFKYICDDCRPLEQTYFKRNKSFNCNSILCSYNPYKGTWNSLNDK